MRAALLVICAAACSSSAVRVRRQTSQQALEALLEPEAGYKKFDRPRPPKGSHDASVHTDSVLVNLSVHLNRVVRIVDGEKNFEISFTLRQNWVDERLEYISTDDSMAVVTRSQVWNPGLSYATNNAVGPFSNLNETSPPDESVSISPEGEVHYDSELSLNFHCAAVDVNEPQSVYRTCSLTIVSLNYNTEAVTVDWDSDYAVTSNAEMTDPERKHLFVPGYRIDRCNDKTSDGRHSCVSVHLTIGLPSDVARTALEAYLPLGVLVLLTDLSLWCPAGRRGTRLFIASFLFLSTVLGAVLVVLLTPGVQDTLALKCFAAACVTLADLPLIAIAVTLCRDRRKRTLATGDDDMQDGDVKCHCSCCAWVELSYLERATALLLPAALLLVCLAFWLVLRVYPDPPPHLVPLEVLQS